MKLKQKLRWLTKADWVAGLEDYQRFLPDVCNENKETNGGNELAFGTTVE